MKRCLLIMATMCSMAAGAATRPNILYIMADDQRFDTLGCNGNPVLETPNIDALAQRGVRFTQAFATTPICCISRACVLTGQYARRHGVNDFATQIPDLGKTYPGILQQNGYYIGFIGKWGTDETNMAYFHRVAFFFDFWGGSMGQSNYWHERDCHFVLNNGTTDRAEFYCDCPPDSRGVAGEGIRVGRANIKDPIHQSIDVIPLKVGQFLDQRDPYKPFCLSISLKAPHGPWDDFSDETKDLFREVWLPMQASVNVGDAESRPEFVKRSLMNTERGAKFVRDKSLHGFLQEEMRKYYRLVAGIDICIGKIRKELQQRGLDKDTVIIYTSDHGHFLGEHGFDGKWLLYEEAAHVPLIIYDPRHSVEARVCDQLALLIDMAPTMLDLAEIPIPTDMQGQSLLPQLAYPLEPTRDSFFLEHLYGHAAEPPNHIERSEGVRTHRWKYINYIDQSGPLAEELYDLQNDPLETNNLALNPEYETQLREIQDRWTAFKEELK